MLLRRTKTYAVLALVIIATSCSSNNNQQQMQGPPQVIPVTVTEVKQGGVSYYDEYPATVSALNQIDLRPQVSGFITGIYFKDGDKVSQGQKLYSIDQQQYQANYQQALANLDVQKTNLVKAQKDADRYHELDKQDAIAKQQVDYADAALEAAKKQVDAAQAVVNSVQTSVRYTTIYAPFNGTIGISQVKVGSPITAGTTVLNTVSTNDPVAVDVAIDQSEIYHFSQLQNAKDVDSTFSLAFGNDVYPYPGKVSLIDRAVDAQTGTIKVRLIFPNSKDILKAGMTGTVRVKNNSGAQSIIIPYKAVTEQLGEFFAYVVTDSNTVTQKKLQLGKQLGSNVIVNGGLNVGDKIVLQGVQNLREGAKVTTDTSHKQAPAQK